MAADPRNELADVTSRLSDPVVVGDSKKLADVARRHKELSAHVAVLDRVESLRKDVADLEAAAADPELAEMAAEELPDKRTELATAEAELIELEQPKDPRDARPAIIEIRAGAGGDEAALFARELFSMYQRYADTRGWTVELLGSSESDGGGLKEVVARIVGEGAYGRLKFEGGTHRVQRIPVTESGGRIHTSTATVAVLPEVEESELVIDPNELRIDVYRSSGPGGQSVNTTDSAVRITHLPTGIVVSMQDEKSQHKNKAKAMGVLRARLEAKKQEAAAAELGAERRGQIGTGDRSEKIRTYNFPQDRVTDHRIGYTTHGLDKILAGELDALVEALTKASREVA